MQAGAHGALRLWGGPSTGRHPPPAMQLSGTHTHLCHSRRRERPRWAPPGGRATPQCPRHTASRTPPRLSEKGAGGEEGGWPLVEAQRMGDSPLMRCTATQSARPAVSMQSWRAAAPSSLASPPSNPILPHLPHSRGRSLFPRWGRPRRGGGRPPQGRPFLRTRACAGRKGRRSACLDCPLAACSIIGPVAPQPRPLVPASETKHPRHTPCSLIPHLTSWAPRGGTCRPAA